MSNLISTLQTGHIGLNVSNLERSQQFYHEIFGFQVVRTSEEENRRFAFLGDGEKLMLTLWEQSAGQFDKQQPGLHHLSFQVAGIEQVHEAERRLKDLKAHFIYEGIVPHAEGASSGGVFFED